MARTCIFLVILVLSASVCMADTENDALYNYIQFESFFHGLAGAKGQTFFPLLNIPFGGRITGMGEAFSAVSDDIGALEANPAGTAFITQSQLLLNHTKLIADTNFDAIAYMNRIKNIGFGGATKILYLPFQKFDQWGDNQGTGIISYGVFTGNFSYALFRNYYFDGLGIGTNVKVFYYYVPDEIARDQNSVSVAFDIGLLTRINFLKFYIANEKNFSFSFVTKNIGPPVKEELPPTTFISGFSYKPISQLLIAFDMSHTLFELWSDDPNTYIPLFEFRFGVEYKVVSFFSIQSGFILKDNPSFSIGVSFNLKHFNLQTTYNPDFSDISKFNVSGIINFGDNGRAELREKLDKIYFNGLEYFNQGEYIVAMEKFSLILKYDRQYLPAKKWFLLSKRQVELKDRLKKAVQETF